MHVCEICGKESHKKYTANHKTVCQKHLRQFRKFGKFLDNNSRTAYDKNAYRICGDVTYMDLYDKNCNVVATAILDTEDLDKVKYIKWKLSGSGYAMNTPKYKGFNKHMTRVILGDSYVDGMYVDHINHNTLDNRKSNLRLVTKAQNQMNSAYTSGNTGIRGVYKSKKGSFYAHIKVEQRKINLGTYDVLEEAALARWYAEDLIFKEFKYPKPKPEVNAKRDSEILQYVTGKVQRL